MRGTGTLLTQLRDPARQRPAGRCLQGETFACYVLHCVVYTRGGLRFEIFSVQFSSIWCAELRMACQLTYGAPNLSRAPHYDRRLLGQSTEGRVLIVLVLGFLPPPHPAAKRTRGGKRVTGTVRRAN